MNTNITPEALLKGMALNLSLLSSILKNAAAESTEAFNLIESSGCNAAMGASFTLSKQLRDATALHHATVLLHLERQRLLTAKPEVQR